MFRHVVVYLFLSLIFSTIAATFVRADERVEQLRARLEIASSEIYTGEPLLVKVSLTNSSQEAVDLWMLPSVDAGTVQFEIKRPGSSIFDYVDVSATDALVAFGRSPLVPGEEIAMLGVIPTKWSAKHPLPLSKLFIQPGEYKLRTRVLLRNGPKRMGRNKGELCTDSISIRVRHMPDGIQKILKKSRPPSYSRAPAYVQKKVSQVSGECYLKEYRPFFGIISGEVFVSVNPDEAQKLAPDLPYSPLKMKLMLGALIKRLEGAVDKEVRAIYFDRLQQVRSRVDRVTAAFIDLATLQALAEHEDAWPLVRRVLSQADRSIYQIQAQAKRMEPPVPDWGYGTE